MTERALVFFRAGNTPIMCMSENIDDPWASEWYGIVVLPTPEQLEWMPFPYDYMLWREFMIQKLYHLGNESKLCGRRARLIEETLWRME